MSVETPGQPGSESDCESVRGADGLTVSTGTLDIRRRSRRVRGGTSRRSVTSPRRASSSDARGIRFAGTGCERSPRESGSGERHSWRVTYSDRCVRRRERPWGARPLRCGRGATPSPALAARQPWRSLSANCGIWFAWASTETPDWARMLLRVISDVSIATSTSRMRELAAEIFSRADPRFAMAT
jgi:hypothetical protein